MRTTPRVILILKQASSAARLHKTLAQKVVLTDSRTFIIVQRDTHIEIEPHFFVRKTAT